MTTPVGPVDPVPISPAHRRTWRSLWRRCSCGLPAPCVDRGSAPSPTAATTPAATPPPTGTPRRPGSPEPGPGTPPPALDAASAVVRPAAPPPPRKTSGRGLPPPRDVGRPVTTRPSFTGSAQPGVASIPPKPTWARHASPVRRPDEVRAVARVPGTTPWHKAEPRVRAFGSQAGRAGHLTPAQAHRTNSVDHEAGPASRHRRKRRTASPERVAGDGS